MIMTQLLFDDEGVISRRQWWAGVAILIAAQSFAGWLAAHWLAPRGLDRPAVLFLSLAILIPFHAVNAKRFRAIGRPPSLALCGGALAALTTLADAFLKSPTLDLGLGLALIATILWYAVDLGVLDHDSRATPERIDACLRRP